MFTQRRRRIMKRALAGVGIVVASLGLITGPVSAARVSVPPDPKTGKCPTGATVIVDWDGKIVLCVIDADPPVVGIKRR